MQRGCNPGAASGIGGGTRCARPALRSSVWQMGPLSATMKNCRRKASRPAQMRRTASHVSPGSHWG